MAKQAIILADTDEKFIASLELKFVKELNENLDLEIITDENGEAISSKLPCIDETYYLKEISSNEFYELPNEVKEVVQMLKKKL